MRTDRPVAVRYDRVALRSDFMSIRTANEIHEMNEFIY